MPTNCTAEDAAMIAQIAHIAYANVAPVIIIMGVVGDVMTIYILTQPVLRSSSVIYMYLSNLAITDLATLLSVLPMALWLDQIKLCSYWSEFFYTHVGFSLSNGLMGTSVWIVVFLTVNQYIAICHPFQANNMTKSMCHWLTALAFVVNMMIYLPMTIKRRVVMDDLLINTSYSIFSQGDECPFSSTDNINVTMSTAFTVYGYLRETISRVLPFLLLTFLNMRIGCAYRRTKMERLSRVNEFQRGDLATRAEKEEKRLWLLVVTIITIFFFCTIPAAPLTIYVKDQSACDAPFQFLRTLSNLMEFTKFALNFYMYCMINPDIRKLCAHKLRCTKMGDHRVPMEHSKTDIRSLTRLLQAADTISMRRSTQHEHPLREMRTWMTMDSLARSLNGELDGDDDGPARRLGR